MASGQSLQDVYDEGRQTMEDSRKKSGQLYNKSATASGGLYNSIPSFQSPDDQARHGELAKSESRAHQNKTVMQHLGTALDQQMALKAIEDTSMEIERAGSADGPIIELWKSLIKASPHIAVKLADDLKETSDAVLDQRKLDEKAVDEFAHLRREHSVLQRLINNLIKHATLTIVDMESVQVLPPADMLWATTREAIIRQAEDWINGFTILANLPISPLDLWMKAMHAPETVNLEDLASAISSERFRPSDIGLLAGAVHNVSRLAELNEETGLFVVRGIEFLHMILGDDQAFQPIKLVFESVDDKLPDSFIVKAFYKYLEDRISGRYTGRGAYVLQMSPKGLQIKVSVKIFAWKDYVCIAGDKILELRSIHDLRQKRIDQALAIYVKDYPEPLNEWKSTIRLTYDALLGLGKLFPRATWRT